MKLYMFDVEEFIKLNKLEEITSPVLFERGGVPNPKGLVSNEIFGVSTKSRKETFAYIDLHGVYFHPHIYKAFRRIFRNIDKVISGEEYYRIDENGHLVKDPNGSTGIEFLYKNWSKINWEKNGGMRDERIDLITKSKKNEVFMKYQIVIPAFYRDIISKQNGGGQTVPVNQMYSKLIRLCSSLENSQIMFGVQLYATQFTVQQTIVEIYDYFKIKLEKKNGLIRKYLLGKNTDYTVRTVISGPLYHGNRTQDNIVDFFHAGVPIAQICVLAYPYIVKWLKDFFDQNFIQPKYLKGTYDPKTGEFKNPIKLDKPESYYDNRYITKAIDTYIEIPERRFDIIKIPTEKKEMSAIFVGKRVGEHNREESIVHRPLTWTDLLYMASCDITKDKHILLTRYPLLDNMGLFVNRIRVLSTLDTEEMEVNGKYYKWYPNVDLTMTPNRLASYFFETTLMNHSYLVGLDGDYDGDQITVKMLWTLESNEEAERILNAKTNILNLNGNNVRKIEFEGIQTLYSLTKDPKEWKNG